MNNIKWRLVLIAVMIDFFGTTIAQELFSLITNNMYLLITAGGVFSILAGVYIVVSVGKKFDQNLVMLCILNTLLGLGILTYKHAGTQFNLLLMLLTPILNLVGGYVISKQIFARR